MTAEREVAVLVVGAGPAGLAAAARLAARGFSVLVAERDSEAGGVPRLCAHSPFGLREFGRVLGGRAYARRLAARAQAAGAEVRTGCSVVAIEPGPPPVAVIAGDAGVLRVTAKRIVLATGAREAPRSARFISGDRPLGVLNTGALQGFLARRQAPFRRPVVLGSELVSLSALLSCRALGVRPVAMIEPGTQPAVRRAAMLLPRVLGVPVFYGARLDAILGQQRVEAVTILRADGVAQHLACDGVLLTGKFVPESSLARMAGLEIDPATGGPAVDQFGRTTNSEIFAAGNLLRPVETAGWCWAEGQRIADLVATDLAGGLPAADNARPVLGGDGVRYVVPQRLAGDAPGLGRLQLRLSAPLDGRLAACAGSRTLATRRVQSAPERRVLLPLAPLLATDEAVTVRAAS